MSDNDATIIEQTAREMISRDGAAAAASIAREWAEIARGVGHLLSAETWGEIADEIERKRGKRPAARCRGREG